MGLTVRPATIDDLTDIVDFNLRLAAESEHLRLNPATVRQGVTRCLEDPTLGRYLVAELDGRVVGQLMYTFEWSDWRCGMFWWLQSVYVAPEHRRDGVFSVLFTTLLERAHTDPDVCGLRLYVEKDNAIAQQTYDRRGLAPTGYGVRELLFAGDATDN